MDTVGFILYLLFIFSWFLNLGSRVPFLGVIRIDLLLICCLTIVAFMSNKNKDFGRGNSNTDNILKILIIFVVFSVPFVEWPGTVIKIGIPNFIKAVVFYFFTIQYVTSEKKLKLFIRVFLVCQSFRILEPLYLHFTTGYWGSMAYMSGEFMNRLSSAPNDIANPNGLAFIITSVIPFSYFLSSISWEYKLFFWATIPLFLYALILTGSRTGLLGLLVIVVGIIMKSNKKIITALVMIICGLIIFSILNLEQKDRYASIIDPSTKNAGTANERIEGVKDNFKVAMRKPFFGHGLGSSEEASYHFGKEGKIAHNLYAEVSQEIGFVGLFIFLLFMKSIIINFSISFKQLKAIVSKDHYLLKITNAMQVWLAMNILFSFASYGLSSYEWYLFGGLSVVLVILSTQIKTYVP